MFQEAEFCFRILDRAGEQVGCNTASTARLSGGSWPPVLPRCQRVRWQWKPGGKHWDPAATAIGLFKKQTSKKHLLAESTMVVPTYMANSWRSWAVICPHRDWVPNLATKQQQQAEYWCPSAPCIPVKWIHFFFPWCFFPCPAYLVLALLIIVLSTCSNYLLCPAGLYSLQLSHTPCPPDPWASARNTKYSCSGEKGRLPADLLPPGLRPKEGQRAGGHFSESVKKKKKKVSKKITQILFSFFF